MADNVDRLVHSGEVKTTMDCHECSKTFVALLDYSITGNHTVECPHCGHGHCRVIEGGRITAERWSSTHGSDKDKDGHKARRIWKHDVIAAKTSSASEFMRQRWLEKYNHT